MVLLAVLFWASIGVVGKALYRMGVDPVGVATLRVLLAWAITALWLSSRKGGFRVPLRKIPGLVLYGAVAVALNYLCYLYALEFIGVTPAIVLVYTHPVAVALLSRVLFREPLGRRKVLSLFLTLVGVFLVAQGYDPARFRVNLPGVLLALGTSGGITFYNLWGKRLVRDLDPWTVLFWGFAVGGLLLGVFRGLVFRGPWGYPPRAWGLLLFLALFPSVLGYGLYLRALQRLEASRATIAATLEPVLASVLAVLFLGEKIQGPQALGGLSVLIGVLTIQLEPARGVEPPTCGLRNRRSTD